MSLQTIEINSVKITFDKDKTKEHRTDFNNPCECQDCRNYYRNIENKEELTVFLATFGIDFLRPEEVMFFDWGNDKDSPIHYSAYYCVSGAITKDISVEKENFTVSFCTNSNINVGHEITDDFFFIVIDIDLPYILDEEREMPPPSFFEKIFSKIKLVFKKN